MTCIKEHKLVPNFLQNTMPWKEELAIRKTAYIIFPWQVERVLHLKFPGEVSRAGEAGFVSCNMCLTIQVPQCMYTNT